MGRETMGKVHVSARIENLGDLYEVERGRIPAEQVRHVEVDDALVDTGAAMLSMPPRLTPQPGPSPARPQKARPPAGPVEIQVYGTARLTIQGRECVSDVTELPDDCPVL